MLNLQRTFGSLTGPIPTSYLDDNFTALAKTVANTIAELRTQVKTGAGVCFVLGYYAAGDSGGGAYRYDASDTTSLDNGGTIIVAADGGRWKLVVLESVTIAQFGAVGDYNGTTGTDNLAAIQAAINWVASLAVSGATTGGFLDIPEGRFYVSGALTAAAFVTLRGQGKKASQIISNSATDAIKMTSPINSSTAVHNGLRDLGIIMKNGAATGGCYTDVGGTYVNISGCYFSGGNYGVIFDQTEIATIEKSIIENPVTGGVWLVNGADHTPGANTGYTNRITITCNQFNGGAAGYAIVDDGGEVHSVGNNNFNGFVQHYRGANVQTADIYDNEMEAATGPNMTFQATTLAGTSVGVGSALTIRGNAVIPTAAQNALRFILCGSALLLGNSWSSALSAAPGVVVTSLVFLTAIGNRNYSGAVSGSATYQYVNDHYSGNGSVALNTGLTLGNAAPASTGVVTNKVVNNYEEGTFTPAFSATGCTFSYAAQIGVYTRIGNFVFFNLRIVLNGTGNTLGSNTLTITGLPYVGAAGATYLLEAATWENIATALIGLSAQISPSSAALSLFKMTAATTSAGGAQMLATDLSATAGSVIQVAGSYQV
jgi:hypothetical protein